MRTDREMFRRCFVEKSWKLIRSNLEGFVLDIGSLDGLLVSTHKETIGIDNIKNKSYIPFVLADMHYLPFKAQIFDTVLMCHVLEHTNKPSTVLKEAERVLKTNGKLITVMPNAKTPIGKLLKLSIGYDGYAFPRQSEKIEHKIFLGFDELKYLIEKCGFTIQRNFGSTPHLPMIERIFDLHLLRRFYWKLGDINKKYSKDLIFVSKKL